MSSLEAIILLTTSSEINDGIFFKFCDQFLPMKENNLSFHIFINNTSYDEVKLLEYISKVTIFKSSFIHNLNIPSELDIYVRDKWYYEQIPPLGLTSGPNIMFLEAIKYCFDKFDTVLVLETDCYLKQNCFEVSVSYIRTLSDFLISGSRYIGYQKFDNLFSPINLHLNGVGFYNTGSQEFKKLVKKMEDYILINVQKNPVRSFSYDMAFTECLLHDKDPVSARRTLNKFINTTYILNCSPRADETITEEEMNIIYPKHIIFHTKRNYWDLSQ
jgi:hypothetical protein